MDELLLVLLFGFVCILISLTYFVPGWAALGLWLAFVLLFVLRRFIPQGWRPGVRYVDEAILLVSFGIFLGLVIRSQQDLLTYSAWTLLVLGVAYGIRLWSLQEWLYFLWIPVAAVILSAGYIPLSRFVLSFTGIFVTGFWLAARLEIQRRSPAKRPRVTNALTIPTLLMLLVAFALFFPLETLPHAGAGFVPGGGRRQVFGRAVPLVFGDAISTSNVTYSGFSPLLQLNYPERIHLSDTPVLRVAADMRAYWRGVVFTRYENGKWVVPRGTILEGVRSANEAGTFDLVDEEDLPPGSWNLYRRLTAQVEFLKKFTNVLFAPYRPIRVSIPLQGYFTPIAFVLQQDPNQSLRTGYEILPGFTYTVTSLIPIVRDGNLAFPLRNYGGEMAPYLQLPPDLPRRIRALAEELTADAETALDAIRRIRAYLLSGYTYTLEFDAPPSPYQDPTDYFLFETRRGFCEHFASAMALLLRSAGIPARVVGGFVSHEYDMLTGTFLIRERDAHAWVEAFVEPWGWIPVDPTPEAGGGGSTPAEGLNALLEGEEREQADTGWRARLEMYVQAVRRALGYVLMWIRWHRWAVTGSLLALLAVALALVRPLQRERLPAEWRPLRRLLRRVERWSRRTRAPKETLREYFTRLARTRPRAAKGLRRLRQTLEEAAYGGRRLPGQLLRRWKNMLKER